MKCTRLLASLAALIALALASAGCSADLVAGQADTKHVGAAPHSDILVGTQNWPQLTVGRLVVAQDAQDRWRAANRDTQTKLMKRVSLSRKLIKLEEVIDFIRAETGVSVFVNWPALELVGTEPESLATVSVKDVPAEVLLEFVLEQVTADAFDGDKASFIIEQGVVKISTVFNLQRTETRVYDVRALLYQTERLRASLYRDHERAEELIQLLNQDTWKQLEFDLNRALSGTNSGLSTRDNPGGGDGGLFGQGDEEPEASVLIEERIDILIGTIESVVSDPDEWVEYTHLITELNGKLIIKTTREYHEEIAALLKALHELQTRHFKEQARSIEVFLLLQDAEALRLKQQYKPALIKVEQALRVDPNSVEAKALKEIVNTTLSH